MLNSSSEVAVTILVRLFVLCTRRCAVFLVEFSVCLGFGIAKTAIIFKSWRFKDGLSAIQKDGLLFEFIVKTSNSYASDAFFLPNAVPITFRSAQREPVGILTSIFVPR